MALTPSALPLLLAGPILRRVEADLVSVWVATSRPCDVSIALYLGTDIVGSETPIDDPRAQWVSQAQTTLAIGANIHVLTATLDLRAPGGNARRSNGQLRANTDYSYDIQLLAQGATAAQNLRMLGLLTGAIPLGYDTNELPGFRTPPEERDKLVIIHGSCRRMFEVPPLSDDPAKDGPFPPPPGIWPPGALPTPLPKGAWPNEEPSTGNPAPSFEQVEFPDDYYPTTPKRDGLIWVDALIDPRGPQPRIAGRPHQLFLTGDQIYADDVGSVVLPALNHVGRVLVGEETLTADPSGTKTAPGDLMNFPPGFRRDIVLRTGGFTTSDGESHLLTFGEFIAHYVMTWSPALWERVLDLWPPETQFTPTSIQAPDDWMLGFLYEKETDRFEEPKKFSEGYEELRANLPSPPRQGSPAETDESHFEEHARWYFAQKRDYHAKKYWTPALFEWWMRRFREGLPRVRRALANVPTYMLADDHEVTDDWYFSRQWRDQVFTRPLGTQIIRHGLMAYSVMQAWGNDPRRWATGTERELLDRIRTWIALPVASRRPTATPPSGLEGRLHELLGLPFTRVPAPPPTPAPTPPTFRPLVRYSYQVEGPCHRVLVIDGRTQRRFPSRTSQAGGIDYEGPTGLFGDSPMATALPPPPAGDQKLTLVVTGVPVLGPEGMEIALLPFQRLARLLLDVDAEAWSYEPETFEALMAALSRYGSVVLLSGDIHMGCTATLDYWSAPDNQPVKTARIVQLIASGLTQDWGRRTPVLKADSLTHDILEQATTTADPAERIGWGTPIRTSLTPPPALGQLVKLGKDVVAHPFYRTRLKFRAPVVPTVGWPALTEEARTPNWAWRMSMVRDTRPESTAPPTIDKRWTPVSLVPDPLAQAAVGWHGPAANRQFYGRVFSFQPNLGVVTFENTAGTWSVRHVIAGELPPIPESGPTPTGLQPFVVHRASLTPPVAAHFATERPKLKANGGWAADTTEPALQLLLHWLPLVWRWASKHADPLWPDLPLNLDGAAKDALISQAADRLAGRTFRRRILRQLGPFLALDDAQLDAVTDAQIDTLFERIGKFKVGDEARALVRPDLERMMNLDSATVDPAAFLDDILLIACSEWVNERSRVISMIAGLLATFRSPLVKHVPVLSGLFEGIWDRWRNQSGEKFWNTGASPLWLAGLVSLPPRVLAFAAHMLVEMVVNVIEDHDPRATGGPALMPPELFLAFFGAVFGLFMPKRVRAAAGWETEIVPTGAGWRRGDQTPETLARQTLSLMIFPEKTARYVAPAQRLSATLIPPNSTGPTLPGHLFLSAAGALQFELPTVGGGFRVRISSASGGFFKQPWGLHAPGVGSPGVKGAITVLRPTTFSPGGGIEVRCTPSIGVAFGGSFEQGTPSFEIRFALNDADDRISFLPKSDGFLSRFLPTDGLSLPIDATVAWDTQNGWRFLGLGELARPAAGEIAPKPTGKPPADSEKQRSIVTQQNKKLGPLTLHDRSFDLSYNGEGDGVTVTAKLTGTVSLNLGPVRIAVSGLGVKADLHISGDPIHSDEPFDLSFDAATPTGLAISVDGKVISGGGFLQRIEAPDGAVSWRGGVALRLTECFDIAGFGIVETGGGRHWSLLVFLIGRFTPPVTLSAGLRLTAIGGMLGLHRAMNTDALRDAVTGVQGNADAVLLPDHPEQRFLELIPAAATFFPPAENQHVAGLMAELEWGVAKQKTNGRIRAGLFLQIGDFKAALYGIAQLGFPTLTQDHALRIRAGIEALYDHENKFARFSLTLIEAQLFKTVHLTGGAALLIRWGAKREWAFTLGGFHPSFRPFIPEGLREPPRLGAHWKPVSLVDLDLQTYAAVTNTSLQFGASAHMVAGASWGGVRGEIGFNFLVMTEPSFHFEADLAFRVTAFLFGCDLISAGLRGSIEGPGPWTLEATIYWEVCGVDISKDLGPYTWGDRDLTSTSTQQVRQILGDAIEDPASWSIQRSARSPVRVRPGSEEILDPRDRIEVRQTVLPLGTEVEVNDRNRLSDGGTWTLAPTTGAVVKMADVKDVFPMRRYRSKPPKETPFQNDVACGALFGNTAWDARRELAISSDEDATDDLILDTLPQPPTRLKIPVRVLLDDAVLVAPPTRFVDRKWTRHNVRLDRVDV